MLRWSSSRHQTERQELFSSTQTGLEQVPGANLSRIGQCGSQLVHLEQSILQDASRNWDETPCDP